MMKAFGTLVISHIFNTHGKCDNFVIQRVKNLKSMVLGTFFRLFVIISCQGMFCSISRHRFPRNFHEYLAICFEAKGQNCFHYHYQFRGHLEVPDEIGNARDER